MKFGRNDNVQIEKTLSMLESLALSLTFGARAALPNHGPAGVGRHHTV
jgi:hypothetical protein